ncbi:MAG: sensor histidine kinase, partial [Chloroflexi bacterium]|nr:sensor histidine kinase [Chloroflexota bacterium]
VEANEAARILFGKNTASLQGIHLADLVGKRDAQRLLRASQDGGKPDSLTLKLKDGPRLNIEPRVSKADLGEGQSVTQIVLRDATEEQRRRAGLKAYTAYVIKALEEERSRIARELHDDTIQGLIMVCRQLNNVEASGQTLPWSATSNLREAYKAVEEVIIGLRDFTRELRPPTLDDLGIMTSVRRLLTDLTERSRIEGRFKVVGTERRLSPDQELALFRVAQESLRNVEHHARASRVSVTMTFARDESRLDVVDNGTGFATSSASGDFTPTGHLGLISMQERIESVGGKLEIESTPGKGTRVSACIPVADADTAADNPSDV